MTALSGCLIVAFCAVLLLALGNWAGVPILIWCAFYAWRFVLPEIKK